MSTTLLYALVMAVAQIIVNLISFFLGYQTDKMASGGWFGFVQLAVSILVLTLGIKAVRDEKEGKYMTYGKGVATGVLIVLYSTIIGVIYSYIHLTYINPNFPDYFVEASRVKWIAAGMSEDKMENAEKFLRWLTKPLIWSAVGAVMSLVFGTVISLLIAIFVKRNPPEGDRVVSP
ncbi:MAG TPA: DUF4199 domain-containing protein [Lacunisphaera sp.]|jgi:ABC-type sugar transport system permease subunit